MKFIIFIVLQLELFAQCIVPNILLETVKLTENETSYTYLIRTNDTTTLNKFYTIVEKFKFNMTKDPMVIDCINNQNCTEVTNALVKSNITNLDLGLFQINYESYPYKINTYFDEQLSYFGACNVIQEKIRIAKNSWSWEVLASYHSRTPHLNKKYKEKLISNYKKLVKN
jgi:hypothetical protein